MSKVKQRGRWSVTARTKAGWRKAAHPKSVTATRKRRQPPKIAREGTDYSAAHPNPNYRSFLYLGGPQLIDEVGIWYRFPDSDDDFVNRQFRSNRVNESDELLLWSARPIALGKQGVLPPNSTSHPGRLTFYKATKDKKNSGVVVFTASLRQSQFDMTHATGYVILSNVEFPEAAAAE